MPSDPSRLAALAAPGYGPASGSGSRRTGRPGPDRFPEGEPMRPRLLPLVLGLLPLAGCAGDSVKPPPPAVGFVPTPGSLQRPGPGRRRHQKGQGQSQARLGRPGPAGPHGRSPQRRRHRRNPRRRDGVAAPSRVEPLQHRIDGRATAPPRRPDRTSHVGPLLPPASPTPASPRCGAAGPARGLPPRRRPSPTPAWPGSRSCRTWRTWT